MNIWPSDTTGVGAPTPPTEGHTMDKPVYHHLLIVRDWEILENILLLTEEEIEPRLRQFAKDYQGSMNWTDEDLEEILSAPDLDELREALEESEMSVYLDELAAP